MTLPGSRAAQDPCAITPDAGIPLWALGSKDGFSVTGDENSLGNVHSNEDVEIAGNDNVVGHVTYVKDIDANTEDNAVASLTRTGAHGAPLTFNADDYAPGGRAALLSGSLYQYVDGDFEYDTDSGTLHGLYYVDGNAILDGDDVTGTITVVATGKVTVQGDSHRYMPFIDGLLFHAEKEIAFTKDSSGRGGDDGCFAGAIDTPTGKLEIVGDNNRYFGTLMAKEIEIPADETSVSHATFASDPDGIPFLSPQAAVAAGAGFLGDVFILRRRRRTKRDRWRRQAAGSDRQRPAATGPTPVAERSRGNRR